MSQCPYGAGSAWAGVVVLHSLDAKAAAGVTRYARDLEAALIAAGEPVQALRLRPWEISLGRRRVGGFLSLRAQSLVRPLVKRDVLHSTFHYAAHPRCDVATVHDLFPETRPELGFARAEIAAMQRTTQRLARRGVTLACDSMATRDALLSRYPSFDADRVQVVPPGISDRFAPLTASTTAPTAPPTGPTATSTSSPSQGPANPPQRRPPSAGAHAAIHAAFQPDAFNVLCVADLNPRKRLDWLLQAARDLPGIRVVHVGPQSIRRPAWQRQADLERPLAAALGSRLVRLGRLDDAGLLACYQAADLLVLPTLDEGFGFPPLEALSCGTPVAVTDLPVLRESLRDQATYFRDAGDLADVLRQAQGRRPTAAQRRQRNAWVQEHHGWPRAARRMMDLYDRVRQETAGSAGTAGAAGRRA